MAPVKGDMCRHSHFFTWALAVYLVLPLSTAGFAQTKEVNAKSVPAVDVSPCDLIEREWSEIQTETAGNALEAECYSKASSAAFICLFLISITSLIYRAGDGDRTRDVQLGKLAFYR